MIRQHIRVLLILISANCLLLTAQSVRCAAAQAAASQTAGTFPIVHNGNQTVTGLLLNSDGVLVVPLLTVPSSGANVVVSIEGERYPAKVIGQWDNYGLTLLKVQRQLPFHPVSLAQRLAPSSAHLRLIGLGSAADQDTAKQTQIAASESRIRRKVPEIHLDGSYYELNLPPAARILDGAALVDAETGDIYGMLVSGVGDDPTTHFAITAASLSSKVATENVTLGTGEAPAVESLVFADGHTSGAPLRQLQFQAASTGRENVTYGRKVSEWRHSTGFLTNAMTSPEITNSSAYFGDLRGMLYCVNLGTMQREWIFDNQEPVHYPPTIGSSQICMAAGYIVFKSFEEEDTSLLGALGALYGLGAGTRTTNEIIDFGVINCVDKQSGAFKWSYRTRYLTQPVIAGARVLYSGFDVLGALNLSDGKRIWERNERHGEGKAYYYSIAGADDKRMWVVCLPAKLTGKGRKRDPYRLEKDSNAWIECYNQDRDEDPIWSHRYDVPDNVPPLCAAVAMLADKRVMYGATARDVFAYNADTGEKLWDKQVFPLSNFAGSLTTGPQFVFCTTLDNKLYAISAVDGTVAWIFDSARAPLCIPMIQDGIVYTGSLDTFVYAVDAKTGKLIWKFETLGKVCGQPRIVGNKLYTMSDDGRLTEIELPQ